MKGKVVVALLVAVPFVAKAEMVHTVGYQGRLFSSSGAPASGSFQMTFSLFNQESGGSPIWAETQSLLLNDGYYATQLGVKNAIDDTIFDGRQLYLEISVSPDGTAAEPLIPRQRIASVPYALTCSSVNGGTVNASSVRVNGLTVIDSAGRLAYANDLSTPGTLNDAANPVDWTRLKNVPAVMTTVASSPGAGISGSGTAGAPLALTALTTKPSLTHVYADGPRPEGLWQREAKPVLSPGNNGSWTWDSSGVRGPVVLKIGNQFRMWYFAHNGSVWAGIGTATSSDGLNWTKRGDSVIKAQGGQKKNISVTSVVFSEKAGKYFLYYNGDDGAQSRIFLAKSSDGVSFEDSPTPVLDLVPGSWESYSVSNASVIVENGKFLMWYSGTSTAGWPAPQQIGRAWSDDGVTWARDSHNPVMPALADGWEKGMVFSPSVTRIKNVYYMFYEGFDAAHYRVGLATSRDGSLWTRAPFNPVFDVDPTGTTQPGHVEPGSLLIDGDTLWYWYAAAGATWQVFVARQDAR